jgi:hypothetical protein
MINLIEGLTGAGKTWFVTRLIRYEWKNNANCYLNYDVNFSFDNEKINRWHNLDELYHLKQAVIGIDDAQRLLNARRWFLLPVAFMELISQHRHGGLDIYTTTQNLKDIDVYLRKNIHFRYTCQSIFRFPMNDRIKPALQLITVAKRKRVFAQSDDTLKWEKIGKMKFYFLSRYWTKTYYDTYQDLDAQKYESKIILKDNKWIIKMYSRDLLTRGKSRL